MSDTQDLTTRVNTASCQILIPEKELINALFKTTSFKGYNDFDNVLITFYYF